MFASLLTDIKEDFPVKNLGQISEYQRFWEKNIYEIDTQQSQKKVNSTKTIENI